MGKILDILIKQEVRAQKELNADLRKQALGSGKAGKLARQDLGMQKTLIKAIKACQSTEDLLDTLGFDDKEALDFLADFINTGGEVS